MIHSLIPSLIALSLVAAVPGAAQAQQKSLKDQLTGTWLMVSYESIAADGSRKPIFGAQPRGILMLDAGGHYAMVLTDPGRAKWKSNIRSQISDQEIAAAMNGLAAQYGSWSVDESSKTLTRNVEGAVNPALAGKAQKVPISLSGDELHTMLSGNPTTGGKTETVYRRAK